MQWLSLSLGPCRQQPHSHAGAVATAVVAAVATWAVAAAARTLVAAADLVAADTSVAVAADSVADISVAEASVADTSMAGVTGSPAGSAVASAASGPTTTTPTTIPMAIATRRNAITRGPAGTHAKCTLAIKRMSAIADLRGRNAECVAPSPRAEYRVCAE